MRLKMSIGITGIVYKEGVSSMRPCENSMVRWANKGSESKKEEKAAWVLVDIDQFYAGSIDKEQVLAALSV